MSDTKSTKQLKLTAALPRSVASRASGGDVIVSNVLYSDDARLEIKHQWEGVEIIMRANKAARFQEKFDWRTPANYRGIQVYHYFNQEGLEVGYWTPRLGVVYVFRIPRTWAHDFKIETFESPYQEPQIYRYG